MASTGNAVGIPEKGGAILIRDKVQQQEMDQHGEEMVKLFASRNDQQRELLANVKLRPASETFDKERTLDLGGGVNARLLWFGGAHTKGDELIFVEPDKTLISGDVVQNKVVPNIFRDGGTPSSWIAVLGQVEKLGALHVLPDHSAIGDGSLIRQEKAFITYLRLQREELCIDVTGQFHPMLVAFAFWKSQAFPFCAPSAFHEAYNSITGAPFVKA